MTATITAPAAVLGMSYTLTCAVSGVDSLGASISLAFIGPNTGSGTGTSFQFQLGPLDADDAGQYTCTATITSDLLSDNLVRTDTEDVIIQRECSCLTHCCHEAVLNVCVTLKRCILHSFRFSLGFQEGVGLKLEKAS